jgi:hypothetical protein
MPWKRKNRLPLVGTESRYLGHPDHGLVMGNGMDDQARHLPSPAIFVWGENRNWKEGNIPNINSKKLNLSDNLSRIL